MEWLDLATRNQMWRITMGELVVTYDECRRRGSQTTDGCGWRQKHRGVGRRLTEYE